MKIVTSDAVYVQKNDIRFLLLNQTDLIIPELIVLKVYGIGIINYSNRLEFVKFEEESEIEFFKNLDWIVDYDSVKDLDESQIIKLEQEFDQQKNKIAKQYNAMSNNERRENEHMVFEYQRLICQMDSLREVLFFKEGRPQFDLPYGIDLPKKIKQKGLRRILSKFKK